MDTRVVEKLKQYREELYAEMEETRISHFNYGVMEAEVINIANQKTINVIDILLSPYDNGTDTETN